MLKCTYYEHFPELNNFFLNHWLTTKLTNENQKSLLPESVVWDSCTVLRHHANTYFCFSSRASLCLSSTATVMERWASAKLLYNNKGLSQDVLLHSVLFSHCFLTLWQLHCLFFFFAASSVFRLRAHFKSKKCCPVTHVKTSCFLFSIVLVNK